jgi:SAM-dependent methyltransferase
MNAPNRRPDERFTGLSGLYKKHRPDYPAAAIDWIVGRCGLGPDSLLIDIGCGTGISTRAFALRGVPVIGIEPNEDMAAEARAEDFPLDRPAPRYRQGKAEETGLMPACADAVTAAQAFHWFDAPLALAEFHRILKPAGRAMLLWNERDKGDPFTAGYSDLVCVFPGAAHDTHPSRSAEPLFRSSLFGPVEQIAFPHEQVLDREGLIGRAFSASYAPREPEAALRLTRDLRSLFDRFESGGHVILRYQTKIFAAPRRDSPQRTQGGRE